ncbi:3,4-dihydroxy-2-butanone-4-phosphate synthase [Emcibacter nanhaiensis]|uniref:3,4-dihydroxy-2-butanone 4-phosphate synthase n=1 Tax=Emcibacter nanhaiensis TaxID=1505037 RepID=A0A501PQH7_9PROT|nr:3,4-dihydroxy-2-butanone-4-phosphate synthase [Emcibacter nanhaiensis]TPD62713.1 3,4-dihydroxy-2-butanone-4-phosphate synthase [Emcibacter nanhaiensis]
MPQNFLSPIEDVLEDAKNGRMFILVDDEDRENEGDLIIPAQMATPEAINFMAKYGRGLICLALNKQRADELGLPPMALNNQARNNTAFTVSIEAKEGITTGISAADRAHTIAVAINQNKTSADIVSPGHVFPIVARQGGVLVRAGHTEAAVDVARLADLIPAGVICEIMNDDGTMARLPDLVEFAKKHKLKVATIADLIAYRRRNDNLVERTESIEIESTFGGKFTVHSYLVKDSQVQHLVLTKGEIRPNKPVLVRMHPFNIFEDVFGEGDGRSNQLQRAMLEVAEEGAGVIVSLAEADKSFIQKSIRYKKGTETPPEKNLKYYGIGAQILVDLGVRDIILLSNSNQHVVGIEGYGLNIVEHRKFDDSIKIGRL